MTDSIVYSTDVWTSLLLVWCCLVNHGELWGLFCMYNAWIHHSLGFACSPQAWDKRSNPDEYSLRPSQLRPGSPLQPVLLWLLLRWAYFSQRPPGAGLPISSSSLSCPNILHSDQVSTCTLLLHCSWGHMQNPFFFFLRSLTWLLTRGLCGIIHDQKLKLLIPTVLALFLFCVSVMAAVKMVWRLLRAPIRKAVRSMWTLHQL